MDIDLQKEIRKLQRNVENEEGKILDFTNKEDYDAVKKCIATIQSDLKYLSIILNGAPIDPKHNMKIRDFLRIHYENLCRMPLPA